MQAIFCCKCGNTPDFSRDAYQMLFPDATPPKVYAGKDEIYQLFKASRGELAEYLRPFTNRKGKFSYFIEADGSGSIMNLYDLMTGRRIG